ncbi:MAG: type I secretion system permease/ATPase [Euryarchaeota archaeon]|nr:type I secretion system permease/ATPase [Euryarchaeota archaeon]
MSEEKVKISYEDHWFWGSILNNKGTYFQIALASIFINLFGLGSAFYIMTVYDRVMPNSAMDTLIALTIGMGIVIAFDFIVKLLRGYFVDIAGNNLETNINGSLFEKITSHDSEFLSKTRGVAHTVREFEGVRDFFTSASMVAFIDLPFMFLFLFVIYAIAGPLAIVPILVVPLVLGVSALIQPFIKRFSDKNLKAQQGKMIVLHELLNNVETVRTVAGGKFLQKKWNDSVENQSKDATSARGISNFAVTFSQTSLQISQAGIVCYGVILVGALEITSGALIACVILSGRVLSPLVQAGQLLTKLNHALSAFKKIDELMQTESRDEKTDEFKAVNLDNGSIQVKELDFEIDQVSILKNISMDIENGEKVGLVGNIGSGKTSLLRNIIGFNMPTKGSINLSGYDLLNIPSKQLREYVGYCPQKVQLFTGSILENINTGLDNVVEDDVIEASKLSCAHEFITKLPGGYNYILSEGGANLSGGQRQAIALARCLVRKPKVLVLDEPTSSMDGATEEKIMNNIFSLPYNPTVLISTHRTNHLIRVDKIGVIIDGQLVQYGPRDSILKQNTPNNESQE